MTDPRHSFEGARFGGTRRLILTVVPATFALALLFGAAGAQEDPDADPSIGAAADDTAVVKARKLNIRSGPGTQHRILRTAARGEKLPILEIEDGWAKIDMEPTGWVLVRYIKVPDRFGMDPFIVREDVFLDWAVEVEFLEEISLQDRGVIWVVLTPEGYSRADRPVVIARRLACGYRERTGFDGPAVVTVWSEHGPGEAYVTEQTCGG